MNSNYPSSQKALVQSSGLIVGLFIIVVCLIWSGINPYDRLTWFMEVLPVVIAIPILWKTYRPFPLTNLLYTGIFFHALVLIMGGAYTYARVPLGFEFAELFGLDRNPYDKLGHLLQGFVPALIAREIIARCQLVNGKNMRTFMIICIVLAISASYELIEWAAALIVNEGANEFLGTQGYEWDTQADMFFALLGCLLALISLSKIHDAQMEKFLTHNEKTADGRVEPV